MSLFTDSHLHGDETWDRRQSDTRKPHPHVDFHDETTYFALLGKHPRVCRVRPRLPLALGFPLLHKTSCSEGGSLTALPLRAGSPGRAHHLACPVHYMSSVFTVLPHFVLRYRQMRPEVAREALLARTAASAWSGVRPSVISRPWPLSIDLRLGPTSPGHRAGQVSSASAAVSAGR